MDPCPFVPVAWLVYTMHAFMMHQPASMKVLVIAGELHMVWARKAGRGASLRFLVVLDSKGSHLAMPQVMLDRVAAFALQPVCTGRLQMARMHHGIIFWHHLQLEYLNRGDPLLPYGVALWFCCFMSTTQSCHGLQTA